MSLFNRRTTAAIALTSALLLNGCAQDAQPREAPDTEVTVEASEKRTTKAEPKKQKPEKKPYKRPTQELQGKDPFKK